MEHKLPPPGEPPPKDVPDPRCKFPRHVHALWQRAFLVMLLSFNLSPAAAESAPSPACPTAAAGAAGMARCPARNQQGLPLPSAEEACTSSLSALGKTAHDFFDSDLDRAEKVVPPLLLTFQTMLRSAAQPFEPYRAAEPARPFTPHPADGSNSNTTDSAIKLPATLGRVTLCADGTAFVPSVRLDDRPSSPPPPAPRVLSPHGATEGGALVPGPHKYTGNASSRSFRWGV